MAEKPFHELIEKLLRRVEERDRDADKRILGKSHLPLLRKLRLRDTVLMEPVVVACAVHRVGRHRMLSDVGVSLLLVEDDFQLFGDVAELIFQLKGDDRVFDLVERQPDREPRIERGVDAQKVVDVRSRVALDVK